MRRILTTHVGSLPRPHDLLEMMATRLSGKAYDQGTMKRRLEAPFMTS